MNAMQTVKLKLISHRIIDWMTMCPMMNRKNMAKVLVMTENTIQKLSGEGLLSFLESLDGKDYPRRTLQEIMACIHAERDSWEDDLDQTGHE